LWSWPGNNPFRWRDPSGRSAAELLSETIELLEGLAPGAAANDVAAAAGEGAGLAGYFAAQSLGLYWGQVHGLGMDLFAEQDASANAIAKAAARARPGAGGNGKEPPDGPCPPNPYGKQGGPAHQAKVQDVARDLQSRGLQPRFEYRVETPSGAKGARFVDVAGVDANGQVVELHQIGRQTLGGMPVAREVSAINDIEAATGIRPLFHPYN
jgi:hypothetical protein